jgi:hypothetical protein
MERTQNKFSSCHLHTVRFNKNFQLFNTKLKRSSTFTGSLSILSSPYSSTLNTTAIYYDHQIVLDINLFKTFKVVVALNLIPLSKQPEKKIAHCLGDIPVYWQHTIGQQFVGCFARNTSTSLRCGREPLDGHAADASAYRRFHLQSPEEATSVVVVRLVLGLRQIWCQRWRPIQPHVAPSIASEASMERAVAVNLGERKHKEV